MASAQLALPIRLDDHAVFESFHAAGNESLVHHLEAAADGLNAGAFVFGPVASGRTHLLQAACARAGSAGVFLTAALLREAGVAMLDGLESRGLVALDDVDRLAGDEGLERGLFDLYNRCVDSGARLVVSAAAAPRELAIGLPDLASRLGQLPAFRIRELSDAERAKALALRAAHRGLELPDETAYYLLTRTSRDMASLYRLLDRLDQEALRAQRRLTVPFVREVLQRDG